MNAAAIIDEINPLPRDERAEVGRLVSELKLREERQWSPEKLEEYEKRMVETTDPDEAERLKQEIVAGFYGDEPHA